MLRPCCVGVVRKASGLRGKDAVFKTTKIYSSPTVGDSNGKFGVVVIHDIFGFEIPNARYIADFFTGQGVPAVVPDLFEGDSWPATESTNEPLEGDKWTTWFTSKITPDFWDNKVTPKVQDSIEFLKSQGAEKIGLVGFCWGGKAVTVLGSKGIGQAGVSVHGAMHNASDVTSSKMPLRFITVPNDGFFSDASKEEMKKFGAEISTYEGMYHGFAVRGDFDNNAAVREAADKAMAETFSFLQEKLA